MCDGWDRYPRIEAETATPMEYHLTREASMNLPELQTLLDYHFWSRDRILDAVEHVPGDQLTRNVGNSFPSIRDTLVHLYSADWVWCSRWEGDAPTAMLSADDFPDVAAIRAAWTAHEPRVRLVVERLGEDGIQQPFAYRAMNGQLQAQIFWHQCQHLVNHGSYHRGQVTTMLRQLGHEPPRSMDLIAFYRQRQSPA
jgi:uncharacterized damage-inducible protein DinB